MSTPETITTVCVGHDHLTWTVLRRRKQQYEVESTENIDLNLPDDAVERDAALTQAIKANLGNVKGMLVAVLHTDRALIRVVELPSSDPAELADMVELQVDKFSPFPIEQMAIGFEVLGGTEKASRVLIAACKREVVEELSALFADCGRMPDRIDLAAAGWWKLMADEKAIPAEGRHGVLLLDETGAELLITQEGRPVVMRSLGGQHGASDEEFHTELAEETGYTLTSLESEWGTMATPDITVWHHGDPPASLLDKLQTECAVKVTTASLDNLPPLTQGIAYRSIESDRLDLTLPEWKLAAATQKGQRRLFTAVAALLLLWFTVLGAFLLVAHLDERQLEQLRADVAAVEAPAEEARVLRRRVESLEQFADRTYSALEVLREITELLPRGVELTSFTYRKAGPVNLRGEAQQVPPIYDFFEAMEQSPLFVEVKPEGVTQAPGGRRNPEFRLTARLPGEAAP